MFYYYPLIIKRIWKMNTKLVMFVCGMLVAASAWAGPYDTDTFRTKSNKEVVITFIKHGSLMLTYGGKHIQVDPVSQYADYATFPKADVILITHEHPDHLDLKAIQMITKNTTELIANEASQKKIGKGKALKNGDKATILGSVTLEAVPAYNTTPERKMYHPRYRDNGYVLTFDGLRIYIAGDTEDIPELKNLKNIDVAFLPVNQPYTMTVEQAANAAKMFSPKVLYPYHYGTTAIEGLKNELKCNSEIEVRIRQMQ
jgi:L-ascorbate metabolism protein UlaG (beta-lactamase superfamily)